jgi:hypothetical protein
MGGRGDRSETRKRNETPNNKCVKRKHLRGGAIFCPSTVSQNRCCIPRHNTNTVYTRAHSSNTGTKGHPCPSIGSGAFFCGSPVSRAQAHRSLSKEGHGPGPLLDQPPFGGARSQRDRPGDCIFVELSATSMASGLSTPLNKKLGPRSAFRFGGGSLSPKTIVREEERLREQPFPH